MSTAALLLVDVGGGGLGLILLVVGRGGLILLVVVVVIALIEICLLFFRMAKEHSVRIALNNDEAIRAHIHYVRTCDQGACCCNLRSLGAFGGNLSSALLQRFFS